MKFTYDPYFAIRGLYYDTKQGNLMKLDYLHNVQVDSVYYGRKPLTQSQILNSYGALHVWSRFYERSCNFSDWPRLP